MNIKMIGIDHTNAPLDVRQHFSFTRKSMGDLYQRLKDFEDIKGSVILSTCNRMEFWINADEASDVIPYEILCDFFSVARREYEKYFVFRENEEAVEHLFSLASGLKSRIVGEDQILTQVGDAAAFSRQSYSTDKVLETLFRMAVTAGKKVKTEAPLHRADYSAADRAIESLKMEGVNLSGSKCLVIGNGEMGKLTSRALVAQGAMVTVTIRQYHSGVVEIPEGCERIDYGERYGIIRDMDVVFSATTSPNTTISAEKLAESLMGRTNPSPLFLVDLAVPRDIETETAKLPGIKLYDIDSFNLDAISAEMEKQMEKAGKILKEYENEFHTWYECRDLVPRVKELAGYAAADAAWRAEKDLKQLSLGDGFGRVEEIIENSSSKVISRILFALRDTLESDVFRDCLDAIEGVYHGEKEGL